MSVARDYTGTVVAGRQALLTGQADIWIVQLSLNFSPYNIIGVRCGYLWVAGHDDNHFPGSTNNIQIDVESFGTYLYGPGARIHVPYYETVLVEDSFGEAIYYDAFIAGMTYRMRVWTKV